MQLTCSLIVKGGDSFLHLSLSFPSPPLPLHLQFLCGYCFSLAAAVLSTLSLSREREACARVVPVNQFQHLRSSIANEKLKI
jgi:hypothetical protein